MLRQLIMRPRDVAVFSDNVSEVVDDLVKRMMCLRSQGSDGKTICNINDLFFKYAMEGEQNSFSLQVVLHSETFSLVSEVMRQTLVVLVIVFGAFAFFFSSQV